jgi:hypothetical protein
MSVSAAFDQFKQALEIDQRTIDDAIELHEKARQGLKDRLEGHKRSFLSGSYPRNTRLDPLDDIDIIAVVKSTEPWDDDPEKAMEAAGEAVRPDFPGSTIRLGAHAAKVEPRDPPIPGVHLDIVAARETGSGTVLEISEREPQSNWKESDPEAHAKALSEANDAWKKRLKPTIKQIKHWNRKTSGDSPAVIPNRGVGPPHLHRRGRPLGIEDGPEILQRGQGRDSHADYESRRPGLEEAA